MAKYALVDLANLFARARHATQGNPYDKAGMSTHIVFRSIRKLVRDFGCTHVVICLEGGSWRSDVYPFYKGKRKGDRAVKMLDPKEREEEEIFNHMIEEFATFMSEKTKCTVLKEYGIEADDFIARWTQIHPDDEHVILTSDTDFIQLLSPTVSIYNGVTEIYMKCDGVYDTKGNSLVFDIDQSKGSIKIKGTPAEAKKKHDGEEKEKARKKPGYVPVPFHWEMEPNWWRKVLFIKLIRGDTSDSIFSAYPGVRYKGSANKVGINEAWEDRETKTWAWNNFMQSTWDKDGETVTVNDQYEFNRLLIDLTMQPDEVKQKMDLAILQAVQKPDIKNIGVEFMRFCGRHELMTLAKEAQDHARYLSAAY